jgi:hypothetical protein
MNQLVDRYLVSTEYCDCHNESLRKKAREIANESRIQKEAALKIFYWIRDEILFNATLNIFKKASETIEEGTVDYCNKINLHTALLRAVGIPARMQYAQINKEILRQFVPKFLFNRIPNPIGHAWCECFLNNGWVSCEALFDESLYAGLIEEDVISSKEIPSIDWDGSNDLILLEEWIVAHSEPISSFDDLVEYELKKVGYPPKIFCILFNWLAAFGSRRKTNRFRDIV